MDEPLVSLGAFRTLFKAEVAVGLLQSNGIPATLAGRYDSKTAPKEVLVPKEHFDKAQMLLAETTKADATQERSQTDSPELGNRAKQVRLVFAVVLLLGTLWSVFQFISNSLRR